MVFLFVGIIACGLEVFIYLYPVNSWEFEPSADPLFNYFSFKTSDSKNSAEAGSYFKGFEIYYRIYNNLGAAANDRNQLFTYNDTNPSLAYNYLINTKNYRRMLTNLRVATPLITSATTNRLVTIRLLPYVDIQPSVFAGTDYYGIPRRTVPEGINFDAALFEFDEINEGDTDVTWGSWDDATDKKFYVQAYVLAYGYDESYKQLYSELYYLGYITILE